jgi:hypothetical protein
MLSAIALGILLGLNLTALILDMRERKRVEALFRAHVSHLNEGSKKR